MQTNILRTSGLLTSVILLACALALPLSAKDKKQVTRATKGNGHTTTVVDLATHQAKFTQWGQASHLGSWTDSGEGVMDETFSYFASGHGTIVAANGDTIDWEFTGPLSNRYTGGSGRFQGVTGGMLTATITSMAAPVFNEDGTMTLEFTYDMIGVAMY
jgi:hypothetical protein